MNLLGKYGSIHDHGTICAPIPHRALHSYAVEIKSKREYFDASVTIQKSHRGRRTGVFGPEIRADRRRINIKTSDTSVYFFFNYDEVLWMNKKKKEKKKNNFGRTRQWTETTGVPAREPQYVCTFCIITFRSLGRMASYYCIACVYIIRTRVPYTYDNIIYLHRIYRYV